MERMALRNGAYAGRSRPIVSKAKSVGAIAARSGAGPVGPEYPLATCTGRAAGYLLLTFDANARRLSLRGGGPRPCDNFSTCLAFRAWLTETPAIMFEQPIFSLYIFITYRMPEGDSGLLSRDQGDRNDAKKNNRREWHRQSAGSL